MRPRIPKYCKNCHTDFTTNTDIRKRGNSFCSLKCSAEYRNSINLVQWKNGETLGHNTAKQIKRFVRQYILAKYDFKCAKCGWDKCNPVTGNSALEVSHIDGNPDNTIESNLEAICPNCHAISPTFKALNKGNGREYRRKGYIRPPKQPKLRQQKNCPTCNVLFIGRRKFCSQKCVSKNQHRILFSPRCPPIEVLNQEIQDIFTGLTTWVALGKKYGVTDNAVRKWAKRRGLPTKS